MLRFGDAGLVLRKSAKSMHAVLGGESLGDVLRQPTSLIQFRNVRLLPAQTQLEIDFVCQGPWQTFRLLKSSQLDRPFSEHGRSPRR